MDNKMPELKPCPFCGAGETDVRENTHWLGMRSEVLSVEVRHWCGKQGIDGAFLAIKGRTREDAINRWNRREDLPKEVDLGALKKQIRFSLIDGYEMPDYSVKDYKIMASAIDHLVALGVIKDKGE